MPRGRIAFVSNTHLDLALGSGQDYGAWAVLREH
jgi:hypothetical protein